MASVAALYALPKDQRIIQLPGDSYDLIDGLWPGAWNKKWWKPATDSSFDLRIRELEKAGALIAAEIDRLKAEKSK